MLAASGDLELYIEFGRGDAHALRNHILNSLAANFEREYVSSSEANQSKRKRGV